MDGDNDLDVVAEGYGANDVVWYENPLVGVEKDPADNQATASELLQSRTNPLNSTTTITFSIARPQFVTLKVYDMIGCEVNVLVNEDKSAGTYSINFNALDLPSGVYFIRMITADFTKTRKIVLVR